VWRMFRAWLGIPALQANGPPIKVGEALALTESHSRIT